jgi:Double-stranded RNA binding motif/3'-5' exonuclease
MTIEYISTVEQFNSKFNSFSTECLLKDNPAIYHVGLDCEYIAQQNFPESFQLSKAWTIKQTYNVSTCILQLASSKTCLVINLCELGPNLPSNLLNILQSGNWIKTGTGINLDMVYLSDNYNFSYYNGIIDVSVMATLAGCDTPNMCYLSKIMGVGDMEKIKDDSLRDWSQDLTIKMLEYAANDGFASHALGEKIILNMTNNLNLTIGQKQIDVRLKLGIEVEKNYVGLIQEYAQKNKMNLPSYDTTNKDGQFECKCTFSDYEETSVEKNKKSAKNEVAKIIYENIFGK